MKNHFIFSYSGNKRDEVEKIYPNLDLSNIDTIIEPYCGTAALSYYISTLHPKKFKYILNDNDKLLTQLYNILKDDKQTLLFETKINDILKDTNFNKDMYVKLDSNTLEGYFIKHKIYSIRPGLFRLDYIYKYITLSDSPIVNFLRTENIEIKNEDAVDLYKLHCDDIKTFIFLDPPYINTCNDFYTNTSMNIYEYLYNNEIENNKAYICLVLEDMWIINLLFKGSKIIKYSKLYQTSKKKTNHLMILNK
jgi:site-specific DNA-adenine methylase